jgi:hypothetical protein
LLHGSENEQTGSVGSQIADGSKYSQMHEQSTQVASPGPYPSTTISASVATRGEPHLGQYLVDPR